MKEVYPKLSSPGFLAFLLSWLFAKTQFLLFQNQPGRRQRDPRDRRHGWPLHRPHSEDLESGAGVCHHDRQLRILQALLLDEKRQQMIILLVVVKKRSTLGWRKIQSWFIFYKRRWFSINCWYSIRIFNFLLKFCVSKKLDMSMSE